jgi:ankyrin repeat protein
VHSDDSLFSAAQASASGHSLPSASENEYDQRWYTTCLELMENAVRGRVSHVKQKLSQGASVTFADYDKRTPLHLAASAGHSETCVVLLESGADVNARDRWGRTPISDARAGNHADVMEILRQAGGRDNEEDETADLPSIEMLQFSAKGNLAAVKERIASGAPVTYTDYEKRTALHLSCSHGHADVTDFLLLNGADPGAEDKMGRTPVGNAVKNGHRNVLDVLKRNGADIPVHALGPEMRVTQISLTQPPGAGWHDGAQGNGVTTGDVKGRSTFGSGRPRSSPPPPEQMDSLRTAMAITHSLSMGNIGFDSDRFVDKDIVMTQGVSSSTTSLFGGADNQGAKSASSSSTSHTPSTYLATDRDEEADAAIDQEHARLLEEYEREKSRLDAEHKLRMEGFLRKKTVSGRSVGDGSCSSADVGVGSAVQTAPKLSHLLSGASLVAHDEFRNTHEPTNILTVRPAIAEGPHPPSPPAGGDVDLASTEAESNEPNRPFPFQPDVVAETHAFVESTSGAASALSILPFSTMERWMEGATPELVYSTESPIGAPSDLAPGLSDAVSTPVVGAAQSSSDDALSGYRSREEADAEKPSEPEDGREV